MAVPDFQCLLDIVKLLQKTDTTLNFRAITIIDNVHNFDTEIQRCINDLIAIEDYSVALELACRAGLSSCEIILAQVIIFEVFLRNQIIFHFAFFLTSVTLFSVSKYF